jgi:hypothetical protein
MNRLGFCVLLATPILSLWTGCAAAPAPASASARSASFMPSSAGQLAAGSAVAKPLAQPLPPGSLRRHRVLATVAQGLGAFLRHVEVSEEPVLKKGEFFGFAIARLLPAEDWSGIDLQPGDIVSRVNGMAIEKPEQAYGAFLSASRGSEIVVDVERAGQPRIVRVPIVD